MVRKGHSLFAIVPASVILLILILPASAFAEPDLQAPVLILPNDTGYSVCLGDSICFDVSGTDQNSGSSMVLDLVDGPVEMDQRNFSDDFTTTVCWVPDASGVYLFVFRLSDGQHTVEDSVTFTVDMNYPPDLADQEFSDDLCTMKEPRTLELTFSDPEGDWRFSLLSGPGMIDSISGAITYQPDTSGQFLFEVVAADDCGEDTALITDNVALNLPPYGIGYDTTFYLCGTPDTCFYFHAYDPENDIIVAELVDGLGTFEQVDDSTWKSCFTPSDFELFTYEFIYRVVDSCVLELGEGLVQGDESDRLDTIRVTVHVDHPPSFIDAGPEYFFLCEPGDTCFSIDYTNEESDTATLSVISGNATLDGKTVCVTAAESGAFDVVIVAEDDCGSDTLVVPVTIQLNRPPVISIEVNGGYQYCDPQIICLRVFPDDPDFNMSHVDVSDFATYNPQTKSVCFIADSTGNYVLTAIGTDSCGVADTTTVTIPISINEAPAISFESDSVSFDFCEVSTIELPVQVDDENPSLIYCPGLGNYVADSNAVLFTPAVTGEYPISVVIIDDCDLADTASVVVSARIGTPPSIHGLNDTSLYLCYPEHICLHAEIVDAEGDYDSIIVSEPFSIDGSGNICMDAYTMGDYELTLRVVDSCGFVAESTVTVSIVTDQALNIVWPTDDTAELCYADTLCYSVDGIPEGATVTVGGTNVWWNEETSEVCFYSDCCLENIITVSVITPCGTYSHQFTVTVKTNLRPLVALPADTTILLCAPATICLPIGVSDEDDNIGSVIVTGADYDDYNDEICFAADSAATYFIHASVADTCGLQSEDSIYVTVIINTAPDVSADAPLMPPLCELPEEVVLTYSVTDAENNIVDTTTSLGTIDGDQIRFNPPDFGDYTFEIVAVDSCGLADTVNINLRLEQDDSWVSLSLPESLDSLLCDPDTIYFDISPYIDGSGYEIEVSPWAAFANGHVRVYSGEGLSDTLLIVGITPCETDTARVLVNIDVVDDLIIEDCPDDTIVFMCAPDTIPFPITLSGTGGPQGEFVVLPPAYYENDSIMVPVLDAGTQTVVAIASSGFCGADTCTFDISAVFNSTPGIIRADTSVSLCDAEVEEVCLPVRVLDPDDNFRDLTSPDSSIIIVIDGAPTVLGANSAATEEGEDRIEPIEATVCFTPETYDAHEITLIATDSCDAADTITFIVTVNQRNWVRLGELGEPIPPITVCGGPGTVCLVPPFAVSGAPDSIIVTDGSLGDSLCFYADTSGTYTIEVIGYAECNVDTLTFEVEVALVYAPVVTCTNADTAIFVCSTPDTARFQVDIDGTYDLLTVLPPDAFYESGYLVVPINSAGQILARVKAENECYADSCGFVIDVSINTLPTIGIAAETDTLLCVLDSICLPVSIEDPDGNMYATGASYGVIAGDSLRFETDTAGRYEIRLWAIDDCDTSETIITVEVTEGEQAEVTPEDSTFTFTFDFSDAVPDTAHVPVTVFPDTARVSVEPYGEYEPASGEMTAFIGEPGTYDFYIIAETECGADTGHIQVVAEPYISPEILFCADTSYSGLCLLDPDTVCALIEVVGTDVDVEVSAGGYFESGIACIPVDTAGLYTVRVIASNELEADTCYFDVAIARSVEPEVTILETLDTTLCGPDTICIPASVFDVDSDIDTIYTSFGDFYEADNLVCFQADTAGVYEITLTAIDSCLNETVATAVVNVDFNLPPDITIDPAAQFVCDTEAVCITVSIVDSNLDYVTTNLGPWDSQTSTVCFYPDTSGFYTLTVTAVDSCGEEIIRSGEIEIERNEAPTIENFNDSTIYICMPQPICLSPLISDGNGPEDIASVTVEGATYENGKVCIIPYTAGDYVITLTVEDMCGATDSKTVTVTVLTDQVIDNIVWPSDTLVELCEADTLRFKVDSLRDGVTVTVGGTNVWWDEQTSEVAFYSDCCLENIITVTVNTGCGSYSHEFTVTVKTNIRPLVVLPQDTAI
ncbi:MAG: hypothetical protein JSU65_09570, partial [Candidatus Zixiibacteriota bacterium]